MLDAVSGLDERTHDAIARVGQCEILVGIPSYNNAGTIGHVARTVAAGLREHFPGVSALIVNADGGSRDGTSDAVVSAAGDVPAVAGPYRGVPGKGSAFRAIFEAARLAGARACAVVDSDLRSITPEWIRRLVAPIRERAAEYVTPLYARHKHDGTITNTIAYPLTRALYGVRLRQPIGGEFGFSGELVDEFLAGTALGGDARVWETDIARFGIDIYMTTTALVGERRVAQAFLGAKIHDPKDPGADLAPMFGQVVGTAFRLAAANRASWWDVRSSRQPPVVGAVEEVEPEEVRASVDLLRRKYADARAEHAQTWREVLGSEPKRFDDVSWAALVYDFLAASARSPERRDALVRSLVPLYFARVAQLIDDAAEMTTSESETLVERQASAFEEQKDRLRERFPPA